MFYWRFIVLFLPIVLHFANNFRWVPLDIAINPEKRSDFCESYELNAMPAKLSSYYLQYGH